MYYLGVDGGGTKTAFEVVDGDGKILSLVKTETCNYIQIGKDRFGEVIGQGAAAACAQAGIRPEDLAYACVGIPSFGEISRDTPELEQIVRGLFPKGRVECVNDVVVAWAGSLGCKPGINLLAGTGSMGYGRNAAGREARAGGWGYFCGDEGSAYWLGKKFVEYFGKEADGRLPKGAVYSIARKSYDFDADFDFIQIVYENLGLRRNEIAKLQLLLCRAAEQGDPCAVESYRQAAEELGLILSTLIDELGFAPGETIPVSYSGGVFKAGALIMQPLREWMRSKGKNISFAPPKLSPVSGAALYALRQSGGGADDAVERLCRAEAGEAPRG